MNDIERLLREAKIEKDSTLGKQLIEKYNNMLIDKREELKELELKIEETAEMDFLKTIKEANDGR